MKELSVVKYNGVTDLYLIHYDPNYGLCRWGTIDNPGLLTWETLAAAQAVALSINSGTVGTPKPKPNS